MLHLRELGYGPSGCRRLKGRESPSLELGIVWQCHSCTLHGQVFRQSLPLGFSLWGITCRLLDYLLHAALEDTITTCSVKV